MEELCDKIDSVHASTLNSILQCEDPPLLSTGVTKFISRFDKLSAPSMCFKLASIGTSPIWLGNGHRYNYSSWSNTAWQTNCRSSYNSGEEEKGEIQGQTGTWMT